VSQAGHPWLELFLRRRWDFYSFIEMFNSLQMGTLARIGRQSDMP
jgi:hypothetical protein